MRNYSLLETMQRRGRQKGENKGVPVRQWEKKKAGPFKDEAKHGLSVKDKRKHVPRKQYEGRQQEKKAITLYLKTVGAPERRKGIQESSHSEVAKAIKKTRGSSGLGSCNSLSRSLLTKEVNMKGGRLTFGKGKVVGREGRRSPKSLH